MRKNPTCAEALLWRHLRGKKLSGYKFRRQHPIANYIVDFCCISEHLVIEVDGEIHDHQKDADNARKNQLNHMGYRVIRILNEQILYDIQNTLDYIKEKLTSKNLPPGDN